MLQGSIWINFFLTPQVESDSRFSCQTCFNHGLQTVQRNSEVQPVLSTRTAAVVSEHSLRWGMHKASQGWHRHILPFFGTPVSPMGPPPTTISKWPFCFPASGSSELAKPTDVKNYNFYDLFISVLFQKANSQLRSTHSVEWILPLISDSPFVPGSPLPLLHLFQEEREVYPRKDCTSVQHISSLCAKKLQHCFMEAKQEESIIVRQG